MLRLGAVTGASSRRCCGCCGDDVEIDAGIEDVEVEVSQEQEDIDQENEAEQDGAAYATADYSGDVFVEQSGTLTAGTVIFDPRTGCLSRQSAMASTHRRWPTPRPTSSKLRCRATATPSIITEDANH